MSGWLAVCSARPRASTQNNHARFGHQWWSREVWHIAGRDKRTLCGRDASDWLTIGTVEIDTDCCKRCAASAMSAREGQDAEERLEGEAPPARSAESRDAQAKSGDSQ